ncbi:15-hydroxyprostaglandin dehydrogenase [Elysia marginata]|uniref:15-hydroxyprostaglandin dehydrogenase [NAD(+)] n=1 Tax=Elysia marginata TaxID=1093978 RepID=A0AAV4HFS1_9GAST|nr:15-hydroxyprostaglandin dehydrogenase [Elysia marginata]
MPGNLKTKKVFLTGGAQGLGKSYVDGFLAEGATVVFGDINGTVGAATEKEFAEKYGKHKVKFIKFDVTDGPKFEVVVVAVEVVVKCMCFQFHTSQTGVVRGTFLAYKHMRKDKGGKGGRIINISSGFGLENALLVPVYCGTKHAIRAFTSSLALAPDVKQLGIEFGVVCPGPTDTDLLRHLDHTKVRHAHLITPDKLAALMSPVDRIRCGLMKLVHLEEMNGAVLYVDRNEMNFYKMEKVNLGENWPRQD